MTVQDPSGPGPGSEADWPEAQKAAEPKLPQSDAAMVMSYQTLRAIIGGIAVALVPVVYIANWLLFTRHVGDCLVPSARIPDSLSGFYYTHMRNVFVGAMCAMGIVLVAYRGFGGWDNWLTNVAGGAAICIGVFPTMPPRYAPKGTNLFFTNSDVCGPAIPITYASSPDQRIIGYVHLGLLFALFAMVFLMVLIQFTRTDEYASRDHAGGIAGWWKSLYKPANRKKKRRNMVYVSFAGGIFICGLLAGATALWPSALQSGLLYAESVAFVFFGVAWLVKGAASDAPKRPPLRIWPLSWLGRLRRWLADVPDGDHVA